MVAGSEDVPVTPPGEEVAVYPLAPVTASQVTVAVVEEVADALTLIGVDRGVTDSEGVEEREDDVVPFVATTVNV